MEGELSYSEKEVIHFKEFEEKTIKLTVDEKKALKETKLGKNIIISSAGNGKYSVKPENVVGMIELKSKILKIEPKINVKDLMFLLHYSWTPRTKDWDTAKFFSDSKTEIEALINAIANLFIDEVRKAFNKGVVQGYTTVDDSLNYIRGRIRFGAQIQKRCGRMFPVEVTYEEFTEDTIENHLVKAAAYSLLQTEIIDRDVRFSLKQITNRLEDVQLVEFDPEELPEVLSTPLNEHYTPSLDLACFILRSCSWSLTNKGSFKTPSILFYMPRIFENFVVRSLRHSLSSKESKGELIQNHKEIYLDNQQKIRLEPDFSFWVDGQCKLVGDCKYKRLKEKQKGQAGNSDLYQLLAYTSATGVSSGILVFADDKDKKAEDLSIPSSRKTFKTRILNLNVDPKDILVQIDKLAEEIIELAAEEDNMQTC